MRNGVLYSLPDASFRNGDRKGKDRLTANRDTTRSQNWKQMVAMSSAALSRKLSQCQTGQGQNHFITHTSWINRSDKTHRPVMKCSLPDNVMLWISSRSKFVKEFASALLRVVSDDPPTEVMTIQVTFLCSGIPSHMLRLPPSSSGNPTGTCASERQGLVAFFACTLSLRVMPCSAI